eukprot:1489464-Heterocapsa_arctica.AAC.1
MEVVKQDGAKVYDGQEEETEIKVHDEWVMTVEECDERLPIFASLEDQQQPEIDDEEHEALRREEEVERYERRPPWYMTNHDFAMLEQETEEQRIALDAEEEARRASR